MGSETLRQKGPKEVPRTVATGTEPEVQGKLVPFQTLRCINRLPWASCCSHP